MAYLNPLNPATPTDADPVSSGDDRIREIKAAIIERLETIVEDIDADPLVLKDEVFPVPVQQVTSGTLAVRPNPPTVENQLYQASDTDQLFLSRPTVADPEVLEWVETKRTNISEPIILAYSAGEARFAPEGDETSAAKVRNAIAAARLVDSIVKVVYVPADLWGYISDADFSTTMFDSDILLVREGALDSWFDPIAYGADPTGVANSRSVIDICFLHASLTTIGMRMVAFTVSGEYLMSTDVDQRGAALFMGPDTELTGAGNLTGTLAFKIPPDPIPPVVIDAAFTYNADIAAPKAVIVAVAKRLHVRVTGTSNGTGQLVVSFGDAGFAGAYNLANLITCVLSYRTSAGGAVSSTIYAVDTGANTLTIDLDGGAQTITGDLLLTFSA